MSHERVEGREMMTLETMRNCDVNDSTVSLFMAKTVRMYIHDHTCTFAHAYVIGQQIAHACVHRHMFKILRVRSVDAEKTLDQVFSSPTTIEQHSKRDLRRHLSMFLGRCNCR